MIQVARLPTVLAVLAAAFPGAVACEISWTDPAGDAESVGPGPYDITSSSLILTAEGSQWRIEIPGVDADTEGLQVTIYYDVEPHEYWIQCWFYQSTSQPTPPECAVDRRPDESGIGGANYIPVNLTIAANTIAVHVSKDIGLASTTAPVADALVTTWMHASSASPMGDVGATWPGQPADQSDAPDNLTCPAVQPSTPGAATKGDGRATPAAPLALPAVVAALLFARRRHPA